MPVNSSNNTGQTSPTTEMCEQFQLFDAISLPEVFPASRIVLPGSEEAQRMTATSGRQCATLLDDASPLGFVVRTCLESSAWNSTECFLTWRALAIGSNRLLFRLVPSMPHTEESEFGLWPTPNVAGGGNNCELVPNGNHFLRPSGEKAHLGLDQAVKMWPTPTSRDHKDGTAKSCQNVEANGLLGRVVHMFPTPHANCSTGTGSHGTGADNLQTVVGGSLNPQWVEWLMGYPIDHTALKDSAIQSSRKSPK